MTSEAGVLLVELVSLASREVPSVLSSSSLSSSPSDTDGDSCDGLLEEAVQRPCGVETFRRLEQMSSAFALPGWLTSSLLPSSSSLRGSSDEIESGEAETKGGMLDLYRFIV